MAIERELTLRQRVEQRMELNEKRRRLYRLREEAAILEAEIEGKELVKELVKTGTRRGLFYGYNFGSGPDGSMIDLYDTKEWRDEVEIYEYKYRLV